MITRRVELERFSVMSSKRFEAVVSDLRASIARPDMAEFTRASKAARTLDESCAKREAANSTSLTPLGATYHKYAVESPGCYLVELTLQQSLLYQSKRASEKCAQQVLRQILRNPEVMVAAALMTGRCR